MARSAHREAAQSLEQALSALAHLPETRATREQAIDLRLALRSALQSSGRTGRASWRCCARRRPLRPPSTTRVGWDRFFAFCQPISASWACMIRPSLPPSVPSRSPQPARVSSCRRWRTSSWASPTRSKATIGGRSTCLEQTMVSFDGAQHREGFGAVYLPSVNSRSLLAMCHAELGMFAEGRAFGEEGLRIAEAVAHPGSLMHASWGIGWLSLRQGDLPRALPRLERAVSICQDADLPLFFPAWLQPWVWRILWAGALPTPCRCSRR